MVRANSDSEIALELDLEKEPRKDSKEGYRKLSYVTVESSLATIIITESKVRVIPTRKTDSCGVNAKDDRRTDSITPGGKRRLPIYS